MDWPKISIVVPNYNGGETLAATLKNIVEQDYPCLEIIVVDGGSSDNSVDIIKQYKNFITWWVSEKDNGTYDAVNKGFEMATGEIFAWIGSGDFYFPNALLTVGEVMQSLPQIQWLTSLNPGKWDHHGHSLGVQQSPGYGKLSFLDGRHLPNKPGYTLVIQQESTFWKRNLWEKIGRRIHKEYTLSGDFDLWAHFFDITDLYTIDSLLAGFRSRQNQASTNITGYIDQAQHSLADMRRRNHWSKNYWREIVYRLKLKEIPGVRKLVRLTLGYPGLHVVRTNPKSSEGYWSIVTHYYL